VPGGARRAARRTCGTRTQEGARGHHHRSYYDATIAVALTCVYALVVSLIAAVIVGGNAPSMSVAIIVFALTGAMLLLRWWRDGHRSASRPADLSHL
jgi:hypothetical protein